MNIPLTFAYQSLLQAFARPMPKITEQEPPTAKNINPGHCSQYITMRTHGKPFIGRSRAFHLGNIGGGFSRISHPHFKPLKHLQPECVILMNIGRWHRREILSLPHICSIQSRAQWNGIGMQQGVISDVFFCLYLQYFLSTRIKKIKCRAHQIGPFRSRQGQLKAQFVFHPPIISVAKGYPFTLGQSNAQISTPRYPSVFGR